MDIGEGVKEIGNFYLDHASAFLLGAGASV